MTRVQYSMTLFIQHTRVVKFREMETRFVIDKGMEGGGLELFKGYFSLKVMILCDSICQ